MISAIALDSGLENRAISDHLLIGGTGALCCAVSNRDIGGAKSIGIEIESLLLLVVPVESPRRKSWAFSFGDLI